MTSFDIICFKQTIKNYISEQNLPKEVTRMVLKEIYEESIKDAADEIMKEASQKEEEDARTEENVL